MNHRSNKFLTMTAKELGIGMLFAACFWGAMIFWVKSEFRQKKLEKSEVAKVEFSRWNEFLSNNSCKMLSKKELGSQLGLEYTAICKDGVTYTKVFQES